VSDHRFTRSIARLRKALEKERAELDRSIDDHMRGWKRKLLGSVAGVGKTITRILIAELRELGSLDRRQIGALVGLATWPRAMAREELY
jgi:transposase